MRLLIPLRPRSTGGLPADVMGNQQDPALLCKFAFACLDDFAADGAFGGVTVSHVAFSRGYLGAANMPGREPRLAGEFWRIGGQGRTWKIDGREFCRRDASLRGKLYGCRCGEWIVMA